MIEKELMDFYVNKYKGYENFKKLGTQDEKDNYKCISRKASVSWDPHFLQARSTIDNIILELNSNKQFKRVELISNVDDDLSMYALCKFHCKSNLFNPKDFMQDFEPVLEFNSIYQYLVFQKAVIFFDRPVANLVLKTHNRFTLDQLSFFIQRFNSSVWSLFMYKALGEAIESCFEQNKYLIEQNKSRLENNFLIFEDSDQEFGRSRSQITNDSDFSDKKDNYYGKFLMAYLYNKKFWKVMEYSAYACGL